MIISKEKIIQTLAERYIKLSDEEFESLIKNDLPVILTADFLTTDVDGYEVVINKFIVLAAIKKALEVKMKDKKYGFKDKKLKKKLKKLLKILEKL